MRIQAEPVICVADDDPSIRQLLATSLGAAGMSVLTAGDGRAALQLCETSQPDLVVLDLDMPELGGLGVLARLQADDRWNHIPVIVLTGAVSTQDVLQCFRMGARDFIRKPFEPAEVEARITAALAVHQRHQQLKAQHAELHELSHTDPLTGLPNRRALDERLAWVAESAGRRRRSLGLLMIDLDQLKTLNDRWGHQAGDQALQATATVLRGSARAGDVVGRWGGDEFLAVLADADADAVGLVADRILGAMRSVDLGRRPRDVALSVSIGAAAGAAASPLRLLQRADEAVYRAKALGRDRVVIAGDGDDRAGVLDVTEG